MKIFIIILFYISSFVGLFAQQRTEVSPPNKEVKVFASSEKEKLYFDLNSEKSLDDLQLTVIVLGKKPVEYLPKKGKLSFSVDFKDILDEDGRVVPIITYEISNKEFILDTSSVDLMNLYNKNKEFNSYWNLFIEKQSKIAEAARNKLLKSCGKFESIGRDYWNGGDSIKNQITGKVMAECEKKFMTPQKENFDGYNKCGKLFTDCLLVFEPK